MPDAVVISDYNKGFLPPDVCEKLIQYYKDSDRDIPIFVDTKKTDLSCFKGAIIKINEKEFNNIEIPPVDSQFIVTLGEKGAMFQNKVYPTNAIEVFDVCGAGDVFLSTLVCVYLRNKNLPDAIRIANKMATISVAHMGTYVITPRDIQEVSSEA